MKHKLLLNIEVCAILLYFFQGGIYERGSKIPQLSVLLMLLISLYYIIVYIQEWKKDKIGKSIILFVVITTISWLFAPKYVYLDMERLSTLGELKNIYICLCSYFPFCIWTKMGLMKEVNLSRIIMMFWIVYVLGFFIKLSETLSAEFWKENVTNNGGYLLPLVFPLIGFILEKKYSWLVLAASVLLTLASAKRGAILCISAEAAIFVWYKIKDNMNNKAILLFMMFFVIILLILAYQYIISNEFLLNRFDSDSSGRDDIFSQAWKVFINADIIHALFGYGLCQTVAKVGMFAHNDWLEILVNQGLLGIVLYFSIFFSLYKGYKNIVKEMDFRYKCMYISACTCFFLKSLFSMSINAPEACMIMICIAISINGQYIRTKKIKPL